MVPAVEYLARLKQSGYFKDLPDPILVGIFYGPIVSIAKSFIAEKKRPTMEEAERAFDACLQGIRKN